MVDNSTSVNNPAPDLEDLVGTETEYVDVEELVGSETTYVNPYGPQGRRRRFATLEAMQARVDEYFESLKPKQALDANGDLLWQWVPEVDPETGFPKLADDFKTQLLRRVPVMGPQGIPNVAGLILFLGFCDYSALYKGPYKALPEYNVVAKEALMRISKFAQDELIKGNRGAVFWLKNHGWADKVETELYGKGGGAIETKDTGDRDRGILKHFINNYKERAT